MFHQLPEELVSMNTSSVVEISHNITADIFVPHTQEPPYGVLAVVVIYVCFCLCVLFSCMKQMNEQRMAAKLKHLETEDKSMITPLFI